MNAPIDTPLPARAWQRMLSGRRLDILDPSPFDIEIGDIAHGLARLARWNGQTKGPHAFTVAQHCILAEAIVSALKPNLDAKFRLAALLHDAPEYVVGDLISPFKAVILRLLRGDATRRFFCLRCEGLFRRFLRFVRRASEQCGVAGADGGFSRAGCVSGAL
jgi:hypothetical protein